MSHSYDADTLCNRLEHVMRQATERSTSDSYMSHAIQRLAQEGAFLLATGRHDWVGSRVHCLNHTSNWSAYAMEVHLTYFLETGGIPTGNSRMLVPGDRSDIDITWEYEGIQVAIECVAMMEPEGYWSSGTQITAGVGVTMVLHDGQDEAGLLRRVQEKMRIKTMRKDGTPCKFPEPTDERLNIIAADVSQGPGWPPDRMELELLCWGRKAARAIARRDVLGLFEDQNTLGSMFASEFGRNRFLRERVHAVFFLVDKSTWRGPFDPDYKACVIFNPCLPLNEDQECAMHHMGKSLEGQMMWMPAVETGWM